VLLTIIDNENGTYLVEYMPTTPGKYVIGVTLDDQSLPGSPFEVNVIKFRTAPVPHWYCLEGKKWHEFSPNLSQEVEHIWAILTEHSAGIGKTCITVNGINYAINYTKMMIKEKKQKKKMIRGTWFFKDDDATTWIPYSMDVAKKLEESYQQEHFTEVVVSYQPQRVVMKENNGSFRQIRRTRGAKPEGREVQRGYNNQEKDDIPKHLIRA